MRRALVVPVLLGVVAASGCAGARRGAARAFEVRRLLAEGLAQRGEWGAAFREADALVAEAPGDVASRLLRARALRHAGAAAEAEADLLRVLEAAPASGAAHSELGVLCEAAGRRAEALRHHREAVRLEPASARAANNLGVALLIRGKAAEAIEVLEGALREHPGDGRLRNNLGFALAETGDLGGARRQFVLAGTAAEASHNLAVAHERRRDPERAWELYLEAARRDAGGLLPRDNLIELSRRLSRPIPPDLAAPPGAAEVEP